MRRKLLCVFCQFFVSSQNLAQLSELKGTFVWREKRGLFYYQQTCQWRNLWSKQFYIIKGVVRWANLILCFIPAFVSSSLDICKSFRSKHKWIIEERFNKRREHCCIFHSDPILKCFHSIKEAFHAVFMTQQTRLLRSSIMNFELNDCSQKLSLRTSII